jgi:hypothetical protein
MNGVPFDVRHGGKRHWANYICNRCGGVLLVSGEGGSGSEVTAIYPSAESVHPDVPDRASSYLKQAIASQHAPAGAVMLAASAVDAMLKQKGLVDGTLNSRIKAAAEQHLITAEMAEWAHEVRLEANGQRHVDEDAAMPMAEDAKRVIEFAQALAQFLFVLPTRVARGRQKAST